MSHQTRRDPLPAEYQYQPWASAIPHGHTWYWTSGNTRRCDCGAVDHFGLQHNTVEPWHGPTPGADPRACPSCHGPSLRGDLCFNCTAGPAEPTHDTPWAV